MRKKKTPEKRGTWRFVTDDGSRWRWEREEATGTIKRSKPPFALLEECVKDASKHGFGAWKGEERRSVTPRYDALAMVH